MECQISDEQSVFIPCILFFEEILREIGGLTEPIAQRLLELWYQTYNALGNEETKNPDVTVEL